MKRWNSHSKLFTYALHLQGYPNYIIFIFWFAWGKTESTKLLDTWDGRLFHPDLFLRSVDHLKWIIVFAAT